MNPIFKNLSKRMLRATALLTLVMLPFITTGCGGAGGGGAGFDSGSYGGGLEGTNTDTGGLKSFSGKIVNESGAPIEGAKVEIQTNTDGDESATTETGPDGTYSILLPVKPEAEVALVVTENEDSDAQVISLGNVPLEVRAVTVDLTKQENGSFEPEFSGIEFAPQENHDPIVLETPVPPLSPPVVAPTPTPDNNFTPDNDELSVLPTPTPTPDATPDPTPPGDESSEQAPPPPSPPADDSDLNCRHSLDSVECEHPGDDASEDSELADPIDDDSDDAGSDTDGDTSDDTDSI